MAPVKFVRLLVILAGALLGSTWGLLQLTREHARKLRGEAEKLRADHDEARDVVHRSLPCPERAALVGGAIGALVVYLLLRVIL